MDGWMTTITNGCHMFSPTELWSHRGSLTAVEHTHRTVKFEQNKTTLGHYFEDCSVCGLESSYQWNWKHSLLLHEPWLTQLSWWWRVTDLCSRWAQQLVLIQSFQSLIVLHVSCWKEVTLDDGIVCNLKLTCCLTLFRKVNLEIYCCFAGFWPGWKTTLRHDKILILWHFFAKERNISFCLRPSLSLVRSVFSLTV